MRQITRREVTRDLDGRVLQLAGELLTDDGRGRIFVSNRRMATWCSSCRRPLTDISEVRGRCEWCRAGRNTCVTCWSRCGLCNRVLGGCCARGYSGRASGAVCPGCLQRLQRRQAYDDAIAAGRSAAQMRLLFHRERLRQYALKLQAQRFRTMTRLALFREMLRNRNSSGGRYVRWRFE
jgi:hypothetical protein